MKICIVGAGAIGTWIGAKLGAFGHEVSVLARGQTLASIQEGGLRLEDESGSIGCRVRAGATGEELGVQDLLVVSVKAPALRAVAPALQAMMGPRTLVLTTMNGLPWWFLQHLQGPLHGERLLSVDPDGAIAAALPVSQTLGAVVRASCSVVAPGHARLKPDAPGAAKLSRLLIGAPGGPSERAETLAVLLNEAGISTEVTPSIHRDIWYKLWGNMTMNPISALTRADCLAILDDPLVEGFATAVMREAAQIGVAIGCPVNQDPEERHGQTRRLGAFKTSTLQDVEAGKPIELDALLTAPHEIGRRLGIATPNMDVLLGLTRLMGRSLGLYEPASS